jgi:hypothetical protein
LQSDKWPKARVAGFSISFDGFGAGLEQSLENPLGKCGLELHQWMYRYAHVPGNDQ